MSGLADTHIHTYTHIYIHACIHICAGNLTDAPEVALANEEAELETFVCDKAVRRIVDREGWKREGWKREGWKRRDRRVVRGTGTENLCKRQR